MGERQTCIAEAIEFVLHQILADLEFMVILDGLTHAVTGIVERYQQTRCTP